jgi:hypothetical protein
VDPNGSDWSKPPPPAIRERPREGLRCDDLTARQIVRLVARQLPAARTVGPASPGGSALAKTRSNPAGLERACAAGGAHRYLDRRERLEKYGHEEAALLWLSVSELQGILCGFDVVDAAGL